MMTGNEEELKNFADVVDEVLREVDGNLIVDTYPILDYLSRCVAPWKERGSHIDRRQV